MKGTYTRNQARERLGLKNTYAFVRLEKMYPEAFVIMTRDAYKHALYDKAIVDSFANWRERFKEEKHEQAKST